VEVDVPERTFEVLSFDYDHQPVRVIQVDGEPWFIADDLCKILKTSLMPAVWSVDPEDRCKLNTRRVVGRAAVHGNGPDGSVWLLAEAALYELVCQSHRPAARSFKRWITHDVLPTIRHVDPPQEAPSVVRHTVHLKTVGKRQRTPTTLYRFFGQQGQLLYVGISWRMAERVGAHRAEQPWWGDVCSVEMEQYLDRASAQAAELAAIQGENPLYNVQGRSA
jgi:prophage antirepressor-like protein